MAVTSLRELAQFLKEEIKKYGEQVGEVGEEGIGTVVEVGDGTARIRGLNDVVYNEMLEFENGELGIALNVEEHSIGSVILGEFETIKEGDTVKRTRRLLSVPVGENLIGRIINPLGMPLDDKGPIESQAYRPVEIVAPGVIKRQPVNVPLQTGIKAIDAMIPIGRGQRELIIGDRSTGKTAIAIDTIINQKDTDVIAIYVAIGQKASQIAYVIEALERYGAMKHTIIVTATASDPAALRYIAPYAGCAIGEWFMYEQHRDVLIVYDDLSKHANAYRELSLLLRRPPGREAYPGDIFYLHSRLLERAVRLADKYGGGSLTALPIIETQEGEVSAYIPTNVISITDGQIYLIPSLFAAGVRPAIDVGISVSRVGGNAQIKAMKKVAGSLRLDLAQFRELEAFAQLGSELDKATLKQLERGYRLVELLKQDQYQPMPVEEQVVSIYTGVEGYLDDIPVEKVRQFEKEFLEYMRQKHQDILEHIATKKTLPEDIEAKLINAIKEFKNIFMKNEKSA